MSFMVTIYGKILEANSDPWSGMSRFYPRAWSCLQQSVRIKSLSLSLLLFSLLLSCCCSSCCCSCCCKSQTNRLGRRKKKQSHTHTHKKARKKRRTNKQTKESKANVAGGTSASKDARTYIHTSPTPHRFLHCVLPRCQRRQAACVRNELTLWIDKTSCCWCCCWCRRFGRSQSCSTRPAAQLAGLMATS